VLDISKKVMTGTASINPSKSSFAFRPEKYPQIPSKQTKTVEKNHRPSE